MTEPLLSNATTRGPADALRAVALASLSPAS